MNISKYLRITLLILILISVAAGPCLYIERLSKASDTASNELLSRFEFENFAAAAIFYSENQCNRKPILQRTPSTLLYSWSGKTPACSILGLYKISERIPISSKLTNSYTLTSLHCLLTI